MKTPSPNVVNFTKSQLLSNPGLTFAGTFDFVVFSRARFSGWIARIPFSRAQAAIGRTFAVLVHKLR